jgi:hypothetical protein
MKKLLSTALLGLLGLALSSSQASAGWWSCCCKDKCGITLVARQYNAFSPFCLDSCNVCIPNAGNCGYGSACSVQGGTFLGELPTTTDGMAKAQSITPGQPLPAGNAQTYVGQVQPQVLQQWGPGMVNPNFAPYYAPPATMPGAR